MWLIASPPPAAPTGAASTVATHLPGRGAVGGRGQPGEPPRLGDGGRAREGPRPGIKLQGRRDEGGRRPRADRWHPMVVLMGGTTGTAPGGATCGRAESYA